MMRVAFHLRAAGAALAMVWSAGVFAQDATLAEAHREMREALEEQVPPLPLPPSFPPPAAAPVPARDRGEKPTPTPAGAPAMPVEAATRAVEAAKDRAAVVSDRVTGRAEVAASPGPSGTLTAAPADLAQSATANAQETAARERSPTPPPPPPPPRR